MNVPSTRPLIGIVTRDMSHIFPLPAIGTPRSYFEAIAAAGGTPLFIPLTQDRELLDDLYARCDGLLLAGGEDIDPAQYNEPRHPRLGALSPLRDDVELTLARRTVKERKPLLGICRGMQLINVALGGTLFQDIPSEVPNAIAHREPLDQIDMARPLHPIALAPDSWLAQQLETTELIVNSIHHQALRDVAPRLRITGRAPDGIIEAVEGNGPGFLVGVQSHPEEVWRSVDHRWAQVFAGFIRACRAG